nr:MAG TPA: hypothetical protein [Caudoviricetes sp.]
MWSASAELGLRCPLLLYWSLTPHAGQCVMPMAWARASTCFLNCLCSLVLVLLTAILFSSFLFVVCVRWWRVAASARRAPPPSNTTLSVLSFLFFLSLLAFLLFWNGGCRVVRAQPCEHARDTTVAFACSGLST